MIIRRIHIKDICVYAFNQFICILIEHKMLLGIIDHFGRFHNH